MSADDENAEISPSQLPYSVGYKRPPIHSQFKPRQTSNPNGRPKGRRNLKHDLQAEFSATTSTSFSP